MECDICYSQDKVIKCKRCNFFICKNCLIKIENKLIADKILFTCCVCKYSNQLNLKKLNRKHLLEYTKKINERSNMPQPVEIINYNERPIIIFNIPVFANKIDYYKTNIILIKTNAIYDYVHYTIDTESITIPIEKIRDIERKFIRRQLPPMKNYYYYQCLNESEYGIMEDLKLYQIVRDGYVENFN